jgi:hypothetical protein
MGYYAAGGYYSAGGFSFKKLRHWAAHAAAGIASNPILSGAISLIPGGGTALMGLEAMNALGGSSHKSAVASSNAGTPGHNARAAQRGGRRRRPRYHRARAY